MRGLEIQGDKQVRVRDYPDPEPGAGEVLVRMKASTICGSDIHVYNWPQERCERLKDRVPGHEPSGVVEQVGHGVTTVKPGDRVTIYHYFSCGHCEQCRKGMMQWCRETKGCGLGVDGGHADFILAPERNCLRLPDELSFVDGAFIACIAGTSFSALKKLQPSGEDTLAVYGLGPVGLTGVMMGKAFGARVIGIGRRAIRLDLAEELGADEVIDIDTCEDVPKAVRELTDGGADLAYETAGAAAAHEWLVGSLRRGGEAVFVAGATEGKSINPGAIVGAQLTLRGSFVMPIGMYEELTRFMIRHELDCEKMVTHRFSIEQGPEAYALMDEGECGKVLFEWE